MSNVMFQPTPPSRGGDTREDDRDQARRREVSTHAALQGAATPALREPRTSVRDVSTHAALDGRRHAPGSSSEAAHPPRFNPRRPPGAATRVNIVPDRARVFMEFQPTPPATGGDTRTRSPCRRWRSSSFNPRRNGRRHTRASVLPIWFAAMFQPTPPATGGDTSARCRTSGRSSGRFNPRRPQRAATLGLFSAVCVHLLWFQPTPPATGGDTSLDSMLKEVELLFQTHAARNGRRHVDALIVDEAHAFKFQPTPPATGGDTSPRRA